MLSGTFIIDRGNSRESAFTADNRATDILCCFHEFLGPAGHFPQNVFENLRKFCDSGNSHIDFLNLIPGRIINDSGSRQSKEGLKGPNRILRGFPEDSIHVDAGDGTVDICNGV